MTSSCARSPTSIEDPWLGGLFAHFPDLAVSLPTANRCSLLAQLRSGESTVYAYTGHTELCFAHLRTGVTCEHNRTYAIVDPTVREVPRVSALRIGHQAYTMVTCGICHEESLSEIGELDSCDHGYTFVSVRTVLHSQQSYPFELWICCSFCFACIQQWAQIESKCPFCKARFTSITRKALDLEKLPNSDGECDDTLKQKFPGTVLETTQVPERNQVCHRNDHSLGSAPGSPCTVHLDIHRTCPVGVGTAVDWCNTCTLIHATTCLLRSDEC